MLSGTAPLVAKVPISRTVVKREREKELRAALWMMRDAIDRYKDAADRGAFIIKLGARVILPTWMSW